MRRWCLLTGCAAVLVGCGGTVQRAQLLAAPSSYLLGIDRLVSPDFVSDAAPHPVSAEALAVSAGTPPAQLAAAGFAAAATEDFWREVGSLALSNGPVQVVDTVEEFASRAGASAVYSSDILHLDAVPGSSAVSTGSLGDSAHATTRTARATDGTVVAEITVEWRIDNLVDVLVVRGRNGAVRPDDALLLAHRQTVDELGLAPVVPPPTGAVGGS